MPQSRQHKAADLARRAPRPPRLEAKGEQGEHFNETQHDLINLKKRQTDLLADCYY